MVRCSIVGLVAGLAALAAFALSNQHGVVNEAKRADAANRLAAVYQDTRFQIGQEEALARRYRLEPSPGVLATDDRAEESLTADLRRVVELTDSPSAKRSVAALLQVNQEADRQTQRMFRAVDAGETRLVLFLDNWVIEPSFTVVQAAVYGGAAAAAANALHLSASLRRDESAAFNAIVLAIVLAIGLVVLLALVIRRYRRASNAMRAAEFERLAQMALTDPLTDLRNHRCFHEDLAQELQRTARTGLPMSLVMLDLDDLKAINDTYGHQAGDERIKALARAITSTQRASDRAYRSGGDEFAVILPATGEWAAFQFAQRLQAALMHSEGGSVHATAGVAQALEFRPKDELIHDVDLALINAKRSHQDVALYTPEMEPFERSASEAEDEHHTRTLASALALAVDAKDSYTRSHCQTVSNLCAVIATQLGFESERLGTIRIAGLLHDVGKIGIPDAILKKPAKLTDAEYEQMKTHSMLGEDIIRAADMPVASRWVRHHHERIDGRGYPDGLAGQEIPLESRIIHVADAFEAMTSDRPYRDAPGEQFAIGELRRHAGAQFDSGVVDALLQVLQDRTPEQVAEPAGSRSRTAEPTYA